MKLSELKTQNETIPVLHPEMGEVGIMFTVCDPMSREYVANTSRMIADSKGASVATWVVNQALAGVVDWSGIDDEEDNPIEFSEEKAKELLTDPAYYWMALAVDEHYGKKKGYLQMLKNRLERT